MSNQESFPTLEGNTNNKKAEDTQNKQAVKDAWEQQGEIKSDTVTKNKKKLNLNAVKKLDQGLNFGAPAQQFGGGNFDFSGGNQFQQGGMFDFSGGQNQGFGGPQGFDFSGGFQQNNFQQSKYSQPRQFFVMADPLIYGENVYYDQLDPENFYELEPGQYLENGKLFQEQIEQEDYYQPQNQQYQKNNQNNWAAYNKNKPNQNKQQNQQQQQQQPQQQQKQQQQQQQKPKKKQAVEVKPSKPKVFKRELKAQNQTAEEKQQELRGNVKKQERFTMKQLQAKEQNLIDTMGDKYYKLNQDKEQINLVFIGHVDAGKSTLCGRVLVDSKEIDEKTLSQLEAEAKTQNREGWFLAYTMDISEDEKAKGKTVETGKAFFELSNRRFTLLDAPGHKNYVPNMIAGACQSDMACLIISAKPGEFESGFEKGGQTREHVQLIKALGVSKLCCVISKMDVCEWSEDRFKQIKDSMKPWLATVGGFTEVEFIPIDALKGQNISGSVDSGLCKWYNGPYLFEHLNNASIPPRNPEAAIRMPILDVQKDEGKVFIYGKIEAGNIFEDINVTTMPNRRTFQIQEIYDAKDRRLYYAAAGENVKIKVKGIEIEDLKRGQVICSTDDLCGVAEDLQCEIQILDLPSYKQIMANGYQCVMHMHTLVTEIQIEEVLAIYSKDHAKFIKSGNLKSGDRGMIKMHSDSLLCIEKFEEVPYLGRFTLRDENSTIAYGTIKKFRPAFEFQRIILKQKEEEKKKAAK